MGDPMRRLGLALHSAPGVRGPRFGYKLDGGARWLPRPIARVICHGGNWMLCRLFGHHWIPVFYETPDGEMWASEDERRCCDCGASDPPGLVDDHTIHVREKPPGMPSFSIGYPDD